MIGQMLHILNMACLEVGAIACVGMVGYIAADLLVPGLWGQE